MLEGFGNKGRSVVISKGINAPDFGAEVITRQAGTSVVGSVLQYNGCLCIDRCFSLNVST
jgi:hypothetical protein